MAPSDKHEQQNCFQGICQQCPRPAKQLKHAQIRITRATRRFRLSLQALACVLAVNFLEKAPTSKQAGLWPKLFRCCAACLKHANWKEAALALPYMCGIFGLATLSKQNPQIWARVQKVNPSSAASRLPCPKPTGEQNGKLSTTS